MNRILFLLLLLFFLPGYAYAGAVIGQDDIFLITPVVFLDAGTSESAVFNYFFTLEVFSGMVALFIRLVLRVFKL